LQIRAAIRVSLADRANFWLQLGGMWAAGMADVALMIGILAFTIGTTGVILLASFAALRWRDLPVLAFALFGSLAVFQATGVLFASLAC
jgi:hypothetical protein